MKTIEVPDEAKHVMVAYRLPDGEIVTKFEGIEKKDWPEVYALAATLCALSEAEMNANTLISKLEKQQAKLMREAGIIQPGGMN